MTIYRVCVHETVGGYIDVDSEDFEQDDDVVDSLSNPKEFTGIHSEEDAELYVEGLISFYGSDKLDDVTHRDIGTCGVDVL